LTVKSQVILAASLKNGSFFKHNLFDYAFVNEDALVYPLRGICICFHGYTNATMYESSNDFAIHKCRR